VQLILRRRNFLINRKLQLWLLLTSLGYILLLLLVVSAVLFAPLVIQINRSDTISAETSEAARRFLYLHDAYWLPVVLCLLTISLHSIYSSHKIAGPVYRFRRVCEAMSGGTIPGPVRLRRNDQLQAEAGVVNAMLDTWRRQVIESKREAEALHDALTAWQRSQAVPPGETEWADVVARSRRLREIVTRVGIQADSPNRGGGNRGGASPSP